MPFQQKSVLPAESATIWRSYSWSVICRVLRTAASNWAHKSLYSCSVIQCLATACFSSCTGHTARKAEFAPPGPSRFPSLHLPAGFPAWDGSVGHSSIPTPIVFILFYCYYTTTKCVVKMTSHCLAGSGTLTYGHGPLPILAVQNPQLCKIVVRATPSTCREAIILIELL